MTQDLLQSSLVYLKGVGEKKAALLYKELQLKTYEDLINYFPFRYVDRSTFHTVKDISPTAAEIQLKGKIISIKEIEQKNGKRMIAEFVDETGSLELVFFQGLNWIKENISLHQEVIIFGKVTSFGSSYNMIHPEIELTENYKLSQIFHPVYSLTEKCQKHYINQKFLRTIIYEVFRQILHYIPENLSQETLIQHKLIERKKAFFLIHFPKNIQELQQAEKRLKFEELFYFQLAFGLKKIDRINKFVSHPMEKVGQHFLSFYENYLPFELTNDQKKVIKEIRSDLRKNTQMNRLLQGDVGSGKTVVALLSMLIVKDNGFQSCFVAPTEILAIQHYNGIQELLQNTAVKVALLTGSTTTSQRKVIIEELQSGVIDILVGTHAIFEPKVQFHNLGLAIIDEQHRFGVAQRSILWNKNTITPHVLVMTATPIPRTLAMSYYSDLDVSVIDELPKGRIPIQTLHKKNEDRLALFGFIKREIGLGRQIYIVYPIIQESVKLDLTALIEGYEAILTYFPEPEYAISVVHGKLNAKDKDFEMQRFVRGETQIMIATTVIEVGVNVPNASVMVIENAERFGLSQLHQLRGRVGRGNEQSYCILMTKDYISDDAKTRIQTMCITNNGFRIAEVDLELRGPGDILGTQQSGITKLKIANFSNDKEYIMATKNAVTKLLEKDKSLSLPENEMIRLFFLKHHKDKISWARIS